MAINRLQFGGLLNPTESFGWSEYEDALISVISFPQLLEKTKGVIPQLISNNGKTAKNSIFFILISYFLNCCEIYYDSVGNKSQDFKYSRGMYNSFP